MQTRLPERPRRQRLLQSKLPLLKLVEVEVEVEVAAV